MNIVLVCLLSMWSVPVTQSRPEAVTGKIVNEQGKPLAGAKVWWATRNVFISDKDAKALGEAVADNQGYFQLKIPENWKPAGQFSDLLQLGIIAYHPEHAPAGLVFLNKTPLPREPITVTLQKPVEVSLVVWDSDHKPVKDAEVSIESLVADALVNVPPDSPADQLATVANLKPHSAFPHARQETREPLTLPLELQRKFAAKSDAQGKVTWKGMAGQKMSQVLVKPAGKPETMCIKSPYKLDAPWPAGVVLSPNGKLQGSIEAPDPSMAQGISLKVYSSNFQGSILQQSADKLEVQKANSVILFQSTAEVTTDKNGQFQCDMPIGHAGAYFQNQPVKDNYLLVNADNLRSVSVTEKEVAKLELEFKPTVLVSGTVQDMQGKPLAKVTLGPSLQYITASAQLTTDANGRFHFRAIPGEMRIYSLTGADIPFQSSRDLFAFKNNVLASRKEMELPPFKVPTYINLTGQLLNDAKEPCGGTVTARWLARIDARSLRLRFQTVKSDAQGKFTISRIDPRDNITLTAHDGPNATEKPIMIKSDDLKSPITLQVSKDVRRSAQGTVTASGKPLADAKLMLWWKPPPTANQYQPPQPLNAPAVGQPIPMEDLHASVAPLPTVQLELPTVIKSDSLGKFTLPAMLDADGSYQIEVQKDGYLSGRSAWFTMEGNKPGVIPNIELLENRPVAGMIVDQSGKPVAGASIIHHDATAKYRTTAGQDGTFRFSHSFSSAGYLIVQAPGFRTQGTLLKQAPLNLKLILVRSSEPAVQKMTTLAPVLNKEERKQLMQELFAPLLQKALASNSDGEKYSPLSLLSRIDPAKALEALNANAIKDARLSAGLKSMVAQQLSRESLEEAKAIVESISSANARAAAYVNFVKELPEDKREQKMELLAQALVHARAEEDASRRILYLGKIGAQYLQAGDSEQGTRLLREAAVAAKDLPTSGWGAFARGAFAEDLSQIDLDAAEKLCDAIQDKRELTRHLGNLAHLQAGKSPEAAERLLHKASPLDVANNEFEFGRYAMRVCYRMALLDLPRAEKIAECLKTHHMDKAQAYAHMARTLVATQPAEAERLLRKAFAVLATQASDTESDFNNMIDSPTVAASFLPIAESINTALVPELLWQALALRADQRSAAGVPFASRKMPEGNCTLALFLARYDHQLAEQLLLESADLMVNGTENDSTNFFTAAALVCPQRIKGWIKALAMPARQNRYVENIIGILLQDGESLWKEVHRKLFMWYPDQVDL